MNARAALVHHVYEARTLSDSETHSLDEWRPP